LIPLGSANTPGRKTRPGVFFAQELGEKYLTLLIFFYFRSSLLCSRQCTMPAMHTKNFACVQREMLHKVFAAFALLFIRF